MRTKNKRIHSLAAVVAMGLVSYGGSSAAHQQWIAPSFVFQSGESAWLSFDHTFGDRRFQPSSGPGSYYTWWIVGPDGLRRSVPHLFLGKTRTVGEIELTDPGTYRLEGVEDMMPFSQIKVNGENRWQPGTRADFDGIEVVGSRVYFLKSVSYVTLESMSRSALESTGDPLEILFEGHPNDLYEGKPFQVRVLAYGEPLTNQEVRIFSEHGEGHDATETCSTNASGLCEFEMRTSGRYLLATNTDGDSPESAVTDGFSHSYSVLIELKAANAATTASSE